MGDDGGRKKERGKIAAEAGSFRRPVDALKVV
jgi:hypothetical protein